MKLDDIDTGLLIALRDRGWTDYSIERMTAAKAFDEFCEWHGLVGWGPQLRSAMRNLERAEAVAQGETK